MLDYDKILTEVSWRVPNGVPNFLDDKHLSILKEVIISSGIDREKGYRRHFNCHSALSPL
jgi:hypothetical protein